MTMSNQSTLRTPQAVTSELDISPATLRRWADEFCDYLSVEANSADGRSHRRYTNRDMETLRSIKELMNNGMTYEQVRQQLALRYTASSDEAIPGEYTIDDVAASSGVGDFGPISDPLDVEELNPDEETALVASNGAESPAIAFLTNTLATLSETQQSILNSQAANRELLGVLIQDNFNLKEENSRLRERILEIERNLAQSRQEDEWRRETLRQELEAKVVSAQQTAAEAMKAAHSVEMPEIRAVKSKSGCLGALFGGGDTQIVAIPRRRKAEARPGASTSRPASQARPQPQYGSPAAQPPPSHPKPTAPPE